MVGETLGSYRVLKKLGEGGMGVLYVAEHATLGHKVAIKLLRPELSKDTGLVQRFFLEAKAATQIQHASIVQIFDYGVHPATGSAFFVMELLAGESLAARLHAGRLPIDKLISIGRQVASSLAIAHAKGIVHRDLKPDNLFLIPDEEAASGERVKVLDFGIAKLSSEVAGAMSMTRTGSVMGTPHYMSPEQCQGAGKVDARADIYSLGCILFEMACGRTPFQGEGVGEVLGKQQFVEPPRAKSMNPALPDELDELIGKMLAKAPASRPQTMEAVVDALRSIGGSPSLSRMAAQPAVAPTVPPTIGPGVAPTVPPTLAPVATESPAVAPSVPPTLESVVAAAMPHAFARAERVPSPATTLGASSGEAIAKPTKSRKSVWIALGVAVIGAVAIVMVLKSGEQPAATSAVEPPHPPSPADAAPAALANVDAAPAVLTGPSEKDFKVGEPVFVRTGRLAFKIAPLQTIKGHTALVDEKEVSIDEVMPLAWREPRDWEAGDVVLFQPAAKGPMFAGVVKQVRIDGQLTVSYWDGKVEGTAVFSTPQSLKPGQLKLEIATRVRASWRAGLSEELRKALEQFKLEQVRLKEKARIDAASGFAIRVARCRQFWHCYEEVRNAQANGERRCLSLDSCVKPCKEKLNYDLGNDGLDEQCRPEK